MSTPSDEAPVEEDLGDPVEDPDHPDETASTTIDPDDPNAVPSFGPSVIAPACRAALKEATQLFPQRNRASDGILGDMSHQARKSDHNQGNAFDLTDDPANNCPAHDLVEALKDRRDPRVKYIISRGRIWNPSVSPNWRLYTGTNAHVKHAHVSILASRRDSTDPWWRGAAAQPSQPPASTIVEDDMPKLGDVTDEIPFGGAVLQLTFDGGIRILDSNLQPHSNPGSVITFNPFSYPGLPPEARQGNRGFYKIVPDGGGGGYTLVATDGSHYHFPA